MFEKFGEFDSYEEINRVAAAQLEEGDEEAIYAIAEENGIDREDAEEYIDGDAVELVTALMAANGKLKVETAELQPKEIMVDWLNYIQIQCVEDPEMCLAVRKKGKSLKECIGKLVKWSLDHAENVDKDIIKAAGLPEWAQKGCKLGIPGMGTAKQLIKEYYLGGGEDAGV
nr:hypothetical protein [Clostridium sp. Marseille-P7770]